MKIADSFNGSAIALNTHQEIEITITGENLALAQLSIFFKKQLSDGDDLALQKGNYGLLSGIEVTANTNTQIEALLTLTPGDFTSQPLSLLPDPVPNQLHYTLNVRDGGGRILHAASGKIRVNLTAIQAMP